MTDELSIGTFGLAAPANLAPPAIATDGIVATVETYGTWSDAHAGLGSVWEVNGTAVPDTEGDQECPYQPRLQLRVWAVGWQTETSILSNVLEDPVPAPEPWPNFVIPDSDWNVVEVSVPGGEGRREVSIEDIAPPDGYQVRLSWSTERDAQPDTARWRLVDAGETIELRDTYPPRTKVRHTLWLERIETGEFQIASLGDRTVVIEGLPPTPTGLPRIPKDMLKAATGKPTQKFDQSTATNGAYFGGNVAVEAAAAYFGDEDADSDVLAQLKSALGPGLGFASGYGLQHQYPQLLAMAFIRRTERLWERLSKDMQRDMLLTAKCGLVAGAATGSDRNTSPKSGFGARSSFIGAPDHGLRGNPNFRLAKPAAVMAAAWLLGGWEKAHEYLENFSRAELRAELKATSLTNAIKVVDRTSPWTDKMVESAVKGWSSQGFRMSQLPKLLNYSCNFCFDKKIVPNAAGGRLLRGAADLPDAGQIGMLHEYDSVDAEGKRSSPTYSEWGKRLAVYMILGALCDGTLDPSDPDTKKMLERVNRGVLDQNFRGEMGYVGWSHNRPDGTWDKSDAVTWGWAYNNGIWTDVIWPWILKRQ